MELLDLYDDFGHCLNETIIRGNKILEQNAVLPSKEYDYKEPKEIIDISESGLFSKLDNNTAAFFSKPNINKEVCLPLGYMVRDGISKNELSFDYYLFCQRDSNRDFHFPIITSISKLFALSIAAFENCFLNCWFSIRLQSLSANNLLFPFSIR